MDDILRRLGNIEAAVSGLRGQVDTIAATIPHLATAASVSKSISEFRAEVTASISAFRAEVTASISAFRAEVAGPISELKSEGSEHKSQISAILAILPHLATAASVAAMEARIIKWFIATAITLTAVATTVAFSIAKFVH